MHRSPATPAFFGEVLFDRFADGSEVLGGAPFNVAWHLQALGAAPLLISRVGDDEAGRQVRARMQHWGMDVSALQQDEAHPTGSVDVRIKDGEPSFKIPADAAFDFISIDELPAADELALLYHGTLALRGNVSRLSFERAYGVSGVPLFLDVNLRAPWWQLPHVLDLVSRATWLKLNNHELDLITPSAGPLLSRAEWLLRESSISVLIVTCGAEGAIALHRSGERCKVVPNRSGTMIDTVGAGDAFAAVILLGLLNGWELPVMLERAQQFAGLIVGQRGATPADRAFYRPLIEEWGIA